MTESSRSDPAHAHDGALEADRDAKIEQLLLIGLDHYFAAQYQQAINVWTRALFLDRSHARARAYIERARSAMAERQRESEELLQHGVDAFRRGEGDEARRLLNAAIDGGAPSDEALVVLERLNRLEAPASLAASVRDEHAREPHAVPGPIRHRDRYGGRLPSRSRSSPFSRSAATQPSRRIRPTGEPCSCCRIRRRPARRHRSRAKRRCRCRAAPKRR